VSSPSVLDCPKQARCPGCPLGGESYEAGLRLKGERLADALAAYRQLTPSVLAPRAAVPTHHYRLRAKLVSRGRSLGLFERGTHRVLDVAGCLVLSPELTRSSESLRELLPLPLHGADLRVTSEGVLVTLLTEERSARATLEAAARQLVERGAAQSVAISVRRPGDVRLLAAEPEVVVGAEAVKHALSASLPYAYAAHGGFVQAHAGQAEYVYEELARGLRERLSGASNPRILELFAGNGSLALSLARSGARVTAVEGYAPAIAFARRAAEEQGLALEAVASDATRYVLGLKGARFDGVIVNPPRRGLTPELRDALGRVLPTAFAYVSCNPHTLARDAQHLQLLGLSLERVEPLDMIPWSDAVEALAWFSRKEPAAPRVLYEDADFLAVEKLPHESAAPGLRPNSLTSRVQTLPGCAGARPLCDWGATVSGVCWFQKADAPGRTVAGSEHNLLSLVRGTIRKQGTISRRDSDAGTKYKRHADAGRHSFVLIRTPDTDERATLADFAGIGHPVLGDHERGDAATNQFLEHRHGLDRSFIHCLESRLMLSDGSQLLATCPLAPDLARVLTNLG
jgi:23S rRNA (uracil1939-C5)-methyltransferase